MDISAFWGKTGKDGTWYPLVYHLLDVMAVSRLLWNEALSAATRRWLSESWGLDELAMGRLLAFLACVHDLGKASPAFQAKCPELATAVYAQGLPAMTEFPNDAIKHGAITAVEVRRLFQENAVPGLRIAEDIVDDVADLCGQLTGGHHGAFPVGKQSLVSAGDNTDWEEARREIVQFVARDAFGFAAPTIWVSKMPTDPGIVPVIAGLISVADWIGSSDLFPHAAYINDEAYRAGLNSRASRALKAIGWLPPVSVGSPKTFADIFPFSPKPMQQAVVTLADNQQQPYLLIVEAPMGAGKTEAALYAIDRAMATGMNEGFYLALPTRATTNAMFRRVREDYLTRRDHMSGLDVQLIHGNATLQQATIFATADNLHGDGEQASGAARNWFTAKKRPLLAPFGVGTIDQSLMAALQTKHWFVRMFGLTGKVVVFDEVHAYDTYMSTILNLLLQWLSALRCTVIMLSATLPASRRAALVNAYRKGAGNTVAEAAYPRLTLVSRDTPADDQVLAMPRSDFPAVTIQLRFDGRNAAAIAQQLTTVLADGGHAAVICNTVDRAQEVYQAICEANIPDSECLLFHARLPSAWRDKREEEVLKIFGKSQRPFNRKIVLVATQVVEQSLDLDFDWMATELAPIDLMLQRAGRLHRHERQRPKELNTPMLTILCDGAREGDPPDFGNDKCIYDQHVLLSTWLAVREKQDIRIPDEIDSLIIKVYEDSPLAPDAVWDHLLEESRGKHEMESGKAMKKAEDVLLSKPIKPVHLVGQFNGNLADDDNPAIHESLRAATRDGRPSIQVICLRQVGDQVLLLDEDIPVDLGTSPDLRMTGRLLGCAISLSRPQYFHWLLGQPLPAGWQRHPQLRYSRVLLFADSQAAIGADIVTLDTARGLCYPPKENNYDHPLQSDR